MWYSVDSVTLWIDERTEEIYFPQEASELDDAVERSDISNLHQLHKKKMLLSSSAVRADLSSSVGLKGCSQIPVSPEHGV